MDNYFEELNSINVNDKTEKKNGLTYLSWAWAWGEVKKKFPDTAYTIYENADGWNYFTDGRTAWVKTGVTVNGLEHIEYLPVMDYKNKSIRLEDITSFDVNKAIQRSLTKAVARHGLGLYIYAGEDLPEGGAESAGSASARSSAERGKAGAALETERGREERREPPASGDRKRFEPDGESREKSEGGDAPALATPNQVALIKRTCSEDEVRALKDKYGVSELALLPRLKAAAIIKKLKERGRDGE